MGLWIGAVRRAAALDGRVGLRGDCNEHQHHCEVHVHVHVHGLGWRQGHLERQSSELPSRDQGHSVVAYADVQKARNLRATFVMSTMPAESPLVVRSGAPKEATMNIKRALLISVAVAGFAAGMALLPPPASASSDGLPGGSWRQSCERSYVQNDMLYATCRRESGEYQITSARIGSCQAFGNRNGTLFCEAQSHEHPSGKMDPRGQWTGSFHETCRDITVDKHGKLKARCRKNNGKYQRSNLQAFKCPSYRAGNRDGRLFCESAETDSQSWGHWGGSYASSCRDISVESNGTLMAECQTRSGTWRRSRLAPSQCSNQRAGNRDGRLFCET